jgi:LmbE family N-acetylglucosaminyl deacetylase
MSEQPPERGAPARVLVIAAHPDDIEFSAAGTVATWTGAGVDVSYCLVTDGASGGFDRRDRRRLRQDRLAEQRAAAAVVGVRDCTVLDHADGDVSDGPELRRDLVREIRRVRPDRVVCHSPQRNWARIVVSHPDHLAVGEAALAAVYPAARNPFAHRDLLETERLGPWAVPEVWLTGGPQELGNHFVDITEVFGLKVKALLCHGSQHPDPAAVEGRQRDVAARHAAAAGLPRGRLAEAFHVIDTRG